MKCTRLLLPAAAAVLLVLAGHAHTQPVAGTPTIATCAIERTGMFNPCATLDASQVQDRRPRYPDGYAVCIEEDGSTPGQAFPCKWDPRYQGNHKGSAYILDGPA